jgi:Zn-finger nucleic acid-binding protein
VNRDDFATCPIDKAALDPEPDDRRLVCRTCTGVFVTEDHLSWIIGQVSESEPTPVVLEPPRDGEAVRTCPRCANQMTKHVFYGIQIDRCEAHGLWFDAEEMQRVLNEAGFKDTKKMDLPHKIVAGTMGAALIAFNVIRFIWFFPR